MKFRALSISTILVMIAIVAGSGHEVSAAQEKPQSHLRLESTTFEFPGAGKRNNNGTIGDFCCTGETTTIRTAQGAPIGFIYFYGFSGGINFEIRRRSRPTQRSRQRHLRSRPAQRWQH